MNKYWVEYLAELLKDPEAKNINAHVLEQKRCWAYWATPLTKNNSAVVTSGCVA